MFMRLPVRLTLITFSFLLSSSLFATDYTFTGSGSWIDPANWENGLIPPNYYTIPAGSTIIINGNTSTAVPCAGPNDNGQCANTIYLSNNYGTLIVNAGATLEITNGTQFHNGGSLIVYGTLINKTSYAGDQTGTLDIYGSVISQRLTMGNQGLIRVHSGGTLRNERGLMDNDMVVAKGTIELSSGGTLQNISPAIFKLGKVINLGGIILNSSILVGNATINGSLANEGTLAPGNSPGIYTVTGDYTATSTAIHNFEVAGTTSSLYYQLLVNGTATLNGTLNVSLISGYVAKTTDNIPIITGTISGTFSSVTIPSPYVLVYKANSVNLVGPGVLPVTFISLDAKKEGSGSKLTWKVGSEQNVLHYEVEKSKDESAFLKIASIKSASQNEYSFTDVQLEAKNFYRIKSVDADGKFKYSITVQFNGVTTFIALKALPTIAKNEVMVQHHTANQNSKLIIVSTDGRMVKTVTSNTGAQQTTLNISDLKSGSYFIHFEDGKKLETLKIIKQ